MKLVWSLRARADLLEIFRFIADDDPDAARQWVTRLRQHAAKAAATPGIGRWLPELPARKELRELIFKGYRVVYSVRARKVKILTVFEGHKILPQEILR